MYMYQVNQQIYCDIYKCNSVFTLIIFLVQTIGFVLGSFPQFHLKVFIKREFVLRGSEETVAGIVLIQITWSV